MRRPPIMILHASGTNRDHEAASACELAGGSPEIVHVNQLVSGDKRLRDYAMLVIPGGFSYSDDLGAGVVLALDLRYHMGEQIERFVDDNKPVLGICNGFQALVKSGFLPGHLPSPPNPGNLQKHGRYTTLTFNRSARFECRWVYLSPNPSSPCVFTRELEGLLYVPVAHGEGRFFAGSEVAWAALKQKGQLAISYVDSRGNPADYPGNPNGSAEGVAGICNEQGNVFGLMPHPEDHIYPFQHPRWTRGESGGMGLPIFEAGIRYANQL